MPVPANAETIWDYLRGQGLSANATAGILGNIEQESGGNPQAGSLSGGYGLIQWTPGSTYFSGPQTLSQQLSAIMAYIRDNGSVANLNANASTPQAAALYFMSRYERPAVATENAANRTSSAAAVLAAASSGNWEGAGKTAATTPAGAHTSGTTTTAPPPQTAQDTAFGGPANPENWPGELLSGLLSALGLSSVKDLLIRAAFLLLGGVLIIVGLAVLAGRGGRDAAATAALA